MQDKIISQLIGDDAAEGLVNHLDSLDELHPNDEKLLTAYINSKVDMPDRFVLSDLIEIAGAFGLPIDLNVFFDTLYQNNQEDDSFVHLAMVRYLNENFRFTFRARVLHKFKEILDDPSEHVATQVNAAFGLFKMTHNESYLDEVLPWVKGDEYVLEIVVKLLNSDLFSEPYFSELMKNKILKKIENYI